MKELISMLEKIWISVAFAEAGEQETAQLLMGHSQHEVDAAEIRRAA